MTSKRRIFIAGNGPSLREVDFDDLCGTDWLGMNAAYRHWDRIGVYPTIYSCLDKVVVKSHATEILRLYDERKIDKFFLVKDILEELPDFPQDDRVFFLEDMVESTAPGSEIFKTAFSDKKTTGSWAVRFAIFLGYRDIFLSGIDASYVEVISEAQHTGVGLELKIGAEVSQNPNYFFDDYQKLGDVYQIPNPERHFGNLHLQSFEAMNIDIDRLGLDVTIRNTARGSQLHRFGVYDYTPLKEALRSPELQAVAVPLTMDETQQFIRNLALWDSPAFHPLRLDSPLIGRIALHLFFDGERDERIIESVREAFTATTWVWRMFSGLKITFLAIPEMLNNYIRDRNRVDVPRKMGPNLHFLAVMRKCRNYRYTQLLETDCVPAKADWLTDLNAACIRQGPFWIAGAYLDTLGAVNHGLSLHINGNALYATSDAGFIAFLDEVFEPALRYLIFEKRDFSLAYDCLVSRLITHVLASSVPRSGVKRDPVLAKFHATVQANLDRFRFVRYYLNISHIDGEYSEDALFDTLDGEAVIVHSRRLSILLTETVERLGTGLNRDVAPKSLQRRLKDTFIRVAAGDIYAFHYYSNLEGCNFEVFDRSIGVIQLSTTDAAASNADDNAGAYVNFKLERPTIGRNLTCRVVLISNTEQRILLRFSRNGSGRFVEKRIEAEVSSKMPTEVELAFVCPENYTAARLQLKPIGGAASRLKAWFRVDDGSHAVTARNIAVDTDSAALQALYEAFRFEICAVTGVVKVPPVKLLPPPKASTVPTATKPAQSSMHDGKRLLMIDSTPIGHNSATGQLKQTFLEHWPADQFLQIWVTGGTKPSLRVIQIGQSIAESQSDQIPFDRIVTRAQAFQPDVIYFRPIDSEILFEAVERILAVIHKPLVIHIMDDWPERLRINDAAQYQRLDQRLRHLLSLTSQRLSISQAMADTYRDRYGGDWLPLANGVELAGYPAKNWLERQPVSAAAPFVIRYMGGLADDMNYASVREIAAAVSSLQASCNVCLEIYTMDWYRSKAEQDFGKLPGVSIFPIVEASQYCSFLAEADALVIAYNFDPISIAYTRLSLANKMPECLASGVPLLAYGPEEVATIRYLKDADCAHVVCRQDTDCLAAAIRKLVDDKALCQNLGERGRKHAAEHLSKRRVQSRFISALSGLEAPKTSATSSSLTYYSTVQKLYYPENNRFPGFNLDPGTLFVSIAPNQWCFTDAEAKQKLWIASQALGLTAGRAFTGTLRLQADRAVKVQVSLGRHGPSGYEGTTQRIALTPGVAQRITLNKAFQKQHEALKLQIDVVDLPGGGSTVFTIDQLGLCESIASLRQRLGTDALSLSHANRLFLEGDLPAALAAYVWLSQQRAFPMYGDNALRTAKALGMSWATHVEELAWVVD